MIKSEYSSSEYSESFSESDHSASQERSAVTSDLNHPSEDYVNYISTDLSADMMSTQNDVKTVVDRVVDADLGSYFKYCSDTNIIFSC